MISSNRVFRRALGQGLSLMNGMNVLIEEAAWSPFTPSLQEDTARRHHVFSQQKVVTFHQPQ